MQDNDSRLDQKVVLLLKHLSNFCISLDFLLINWEIGLYLSQSRKFIISETLKTPEAVGDNPEETTLLAGATF